MKKLLFILAMLPLAAISQKPVASIYSGISSYHLHAGVEAGVAGILDQRYSLVAFTHVNSVGKEGLITAGVKFWGAMWLDLQQESFVAPVIGLQNRFSHIDDAGKVKRPTTAIFGLRYQVYGGFGEIIWQPNYIGFSVGYQFGNVKR